MTELRFPDLRRTLLPLLALFVLLAGGPALAASNFPPAYVVAGIPVDATAQNAVAARDVARADGEKAAFRRLLERLTPQADWGRLPSPGAQEISNLVQDFEVSNERNSGVRYLASYTFRFRPSGVRRLLRAANIPITELASKPVVLLPVLKIGGAVRLWDDPNPWRQAWSSTPGNGGLVPWVVPAGDLTDVSTLDAPAAQAPKPDQLAHLSARYGGGDVVIATATATDGSGATLDITVSRYSPDGTPDSATTQVSGPKLDSSLYQAGVQASMRELEEGWKKLTMASSSGGLTGSDAEGMIEIVVPIKTAHDWAEVRERLAKVPVVRGTDLELMGHDQVRLRIKVHADDNLLRVALAQQDLVLTPGKPYPMLQLRSQAAGQ